MKAIVVVLVLLTFYVTGVFAVVSSDITADWIPVGVTATNNWTYGYEPVPGGAFTQYALHEKIEGVYDIWWNGVDPWIAKAGPTWGWVTLPGYIIMHPGKLHAEGGTGVNECSVARFTATVAGNYDISGSFNGRDGGTKDVYVLLNGTTLFSQLALSGTNSAAFALTGVALAVNDEVDFIIKGTTSYAGCATILCATLTKQFTPSTTSWDATADYYPQTVMPTQAANSFGPWSLGYLPVTGGVPGNFAAHARKLTRADGFDEFDNGTAGDDGFSVLYNFNYGQVWWFKPRPNWSFTPMLNGYPCIRFVAPRDGKYTVSCLFSGVAGGAYQPGGDPNSHASSKAHIDTLVSGVRTSLFSSDVDGFDGTGLKNISDPNNALSSPPPVYATANLTNVNLAQGSAIDFYADPRGNSQFDNTYLSPAVIRTGDYVPTCFERGVYVPMDFNHDCYVNLNDFASFAAAWLNCSDPRNPSCTY